MGSLQEHASIDSINGVCPTLGTTDFGMPKIIEMEEERVIQVGNIVDDTNIGFKNPQRGRVYDAEGIAPTMNCCGGGGLEPKIIQYELSKNWSGTCRQQDKVFDDRGISGTIIAMHERHPFKILETMEGKLSKHLETSAEEPNVMVQKRTEYGKPIRKDYEQGNVKEQRKNIQQLEPRTDGVTNTLTSVQKDNLLVEPIKATEEDSGNIPKVINPVVIQKVGDRGTDNWSVHDYSNCIPANPMSDRGQLLVEPSKVTIEGTDYEIEQGEKVPYDCYNHKVPTNRDVIGTVVPQNSRNAPSNGYRIIECEEPTKVIGSMQKNAYQGSTEGVSPCVTSACGMGGGQTPMVMYEPSIAAMRGRPEEDSTVVYKGKEMKDGDGLYTGTSDAFFRGGLDGLSRTLKSETSDAAVVTKFRIRKLTERECFRLQGVTEEDIDKIQAYRDEKGKPISKTQQYKMAGNSITVDVMAYIFRNLFDMNATKGKQVTQLTLF